MGTTKLTFIHRSYFEQTVFNSEKSMQSFSWFKKAGYCLKLCVFNSYRFTELHKALLNSRLTNQFLQ